MLWLFALLLVGPLDQDDPVVCERYRKIPLPTRDLPPASSKNTKCDATDLYYEVGGSAQPVKARECAYRMYLKDYAAHRADGMAGAEILMMIYANGKGVPRNFDLAIKFACEAVQDTDREPNLMTDQVAHLEKLKAENWPGGEFDQFDDYSDRPMANAELATIYARRAAITIEQKLRRITRKWTSREKDAFGDLQEAAQKHFEVQFDTQNFNGSGTEKYVLGTSPFEAEFVTMLEELEKGPLPNSSEADFAKADAELNTVYAEVLKRVAEYHVAGIRNSQRSWIPYRQAWVKFGRVKYPNVTAVSWQAWVTEHRIEELKEW